MMTLKVMTKDISSTNFRLNRFQSLVQFIKAKRKIKFHQNLIQTGALQGEMKKHLTIIFDVLF